MMERERRGPHSMHQLVDREVQCVCVSERGKEEVVMCLYCMSIFMCAYVLVRTVQAGPGFIFKALQDAVPDSCVTLSAILNYEESTVSMVIHGVNCSCPENERAKQYTCKNRQREIQIQLSGLRFKATSCVEMCSVLHFVHNSAIVMNTSHIHKSKSKVLVPIHQM